MNSNGSELEQVAHTYRTIWPWWFCEQGPYRVLNSWKSLEICPAISRPGKSSCVFFKVCIDHLFGNLESRKRNYCYGKKSGESLEFWIQKSLRTLCELNPSPHFVPYRYVTLHFRDRRGAAPLRYRNRAEITVLTCEQNCYTVWFLCRRKLAIR